MLFLNITLHECFFLHSVKCGIYTIITVRHLLRPEVLPHLENKSNTSVELDVYGQALLSIQTMLLQLVGLYLTWGSNIISATLRGTKYQETTISDYLYVDLDLGSETIAFSNINISFKFALFFTFSLLTIEF